MRLFFAVTLFSCMFAVDSMADAKCGGKLFNGRLRERLSSVSVFQSRTVVRERTVMQSRGTFRMGPTSAGGQCR